MQWLSTQILCLRKLMSREKFHTEVLTDFTTKRKLATPDTDAPSSCQVQLKKILSCHTLLRALTWDGGLTGQDRAT